MVSVCLPSHNTYRLTWVSLTLDVGFLFMAAPAKCSHCSLPWTRSPLLTLNIRAVALLSPPVPMQSPLLGRGVAPLGCRPRPQTWGSSFFFFFFGSGRRWGAPKSLQMVIAAIKLKDAYSLEGKVMTNLDSILKNRDITLPTKVCLVKAVVFPVVRYGCES